jgi:type I restriction enzyme, R subunit
MATIQTPIFSEDENSQVPAIQLLVNLGYTYITPEEAIKYRGGKLSNVILDEILEAQLRKINGFTFKGKDLKFSDKSIKNAVLAVKDVPNAGLVTSNEAVYDLLTLGKSFDENIDGDIKAFTLNFVDWKNPKNNVFHVTEEFEVERTGSKEKRRPDVVLFVNGIPFAVIECKRRDMEKPVEQAVSQHIRNQYPDEIPRLFHYTQLLVACSVTDAKYATTGTHERFWSFWREKSDYETKLAKAINRPLSEDVKKKLFSERFAYTRKYFDALEAQGDRKITEQDIAIYSLLSPERLLELTYVFTVFDKPDKKVCRYQQYYAVHSSLERIMRRTPEGRREGGVIFHTQGSGKSLTMVMMAKAISLMSEVENPKIIVVTDRKDLDRQIRDTFKSCGKDTVQATTGSHLTELLQPKREVIVTTVINKFETVINKAEVKLESDDIFILVDEGHRTQYGKFNVSMQRVFPRACFIGFTGTPILKKDKNTVQRFGGFIDRYTIDQAVEDKAVVPLLYEGRLIGQEVSQREIDQWFDRETRDLTDELRADFKRKFSSADHLNKAEERIKNIAYDVSLHFSKNWKGTPFKGQLTAPDKATAVKIKKYLDDFDMVTTEVLISAPDDREGHEDPTQETTDEVRKFYKRMMEQYGNDEAYNEKIIEKFLDSDDPEIIIVVDKLLTGFDAPKNTVLYITRSLKEHTLLQAIARVNRLYEGKDFGYIIDYYGVLGDLDTALTTYGALSESFEAADLANTMTNISEVAEKLPQKHSVLWDVFKTIKNKMDIEEYEVFLAADDVRADFYKKLSDYSRTFGVAMSSVQFVENTQKADLDRYKNDLGFFQKLRGSVKLRYAESVDYKDYEKKVQKLIDTYVGALDAVSLNEPVNIFDKKAFDLEVSKLGSEASKADTIAHRTKRTITEKMEEDPVFYTKFSKMLEETIEAWKEKRISDAEYLKRAQSIMDSVRGRKEEGLPKALEGKEAAKAFYGIVRETFTTSIGEGQRTTDLSCQVALTIDEMVQVHVKRDWTNDQDAVNRMKNDIDDYLFDLKSKEKINLSVEQIDRVMNDCISVAKRRYAR